MEDLLEELRIKFKRIFINLPEKIRKDNIIIVIDKRPYTWNVVFFEVNNNTELGNKMLKKLGVLKII